MLLRLARLGRVGAWLVATSVVTAACLVPSFEGFQGGLPDAGTDGPAKEGAPNEGGAPPDAEAGADGGVRTFACDTTGLRCRSELEFCCGKLLADSICKAPPIATLECSEVLSCGDAVDCPGSEVCCYDKTTSQGKCEATCAGANELVVCDPKKEPASCPPPQACSGVLDDTVPFCQ